MYFLIRVVMVKSSYTIDLFPCCTQYSSMTLFAFTLTYATVNKNRTSDKPQNNETRHGAPEEKVQPNGAALPP